MKFTKLRKIYPEFVFSSYHYELIGSDLFISYEFRISPDIVFRPKLLVRGAASRASKIKKEVLCNMIFNLGLVEMISYWKATCSPVILIKPHGLDEWQKEWWRDLILKGMAEFFYVNEIDYKKEGFLNLRSLGKQLAKGYVKVGGDRVLVPVGGGKDSAASLAILSKELSIGRLGVFMSNPISTALDLFDVSDVEDVVRVDRQIDPVLLDLNKKGFLNGHTPFSAYIAFVSLLGAVIFGYKYLALSNESSSNEGNVEYLGEMVNHQYSKSFEFESKFREYNGRFLSDIEYFSFLRPLNEIQITKIFSKLGSFLGSIKSCNVDRNTKIWCGRCAKCLSTYILLDPFLTDEVLRSIFYDDLFANTSLVNLMDSLVLDKKVKPFECVATKDEIKAALSISIKKRKGRKLPPLLMIAKDKYFDNQPDYFKDDVLSRWNNENYLPTSFERLLKKYAQR